MSPKFVHISRNRLDRIEETFLKAAETGRIEEVKIPLKHYFIPGLYLREVFMPKGSLVMSMEHKTSELNIVPKGRAIVRSGDELKLVEGPCAFESEAGIRKILFMLEDTVWQTAHHNPDDERDIPTLERRLAIQTPAYLRHQQFLQAEHYQALEEMTI